MKKLLFIYFLTLCSLNFVQAQNITISGTLTDLQGSPRPNHPVHISGDTLSFQYNNTVYTDMSGFYNDVINVGSTNVIDFWLHIPDSCGTYGIWHHIHYNSTTNNFPNNDFSICHPYSGNCTTSFSYGSPTVWNTNDAQISFSSSYTGMTSNYFDRDYHWDFGDGTTNSYHSPTHNFLYDTPYNVCLTMLDETTGCMATYCDSVYIASSTSPCQTTFTTTYHQPNRISINYPYPGPGYSRTIDFGDLAIPGWSNTYTYSTAGVYNVCLTLTNNQTGCSSTYCDSVSITIPNTCSANLSSANHMTYTNFSTLGTFGAAPINYSFDYGDGTSGNSSAHFYPSVNGSYYAVVTMTSATGCTDTAGTWVTIDSIGICDVSIGSNTNGNGSYSFWANYNSSQPNSYNWDFGDGNTGIGYSPNHTYQANGTYLVCVTTTDTAGCVATDCDTIVVTNVLQPQNCDATISASLTPNTSFVTYTAASNGQAPFTYRWNFFGNGYSLNPWFQNGTGYLYHGLSDTTVNTCVEITDATGCIDTACILVYIPDTTLGGCQIDFSSYNLGNGQYNFVPNIPNNIINNYSWDFGNGATSTTASPQHNFSNTGYYQVCLTTIDTSGCTASFCDTIYANLDSINCSALISTQYNYMNGVTQVTFTGSGNAGSGSYQYSWDFGNGSLITGQVVSQAYYATGIYPICLTVTDSLGCTSTQCLNIYIQVQPSSCSAYFYSLDSLGYTFFLNQSSGTGMMSYNWDLGDGNTSTSYNPIHQYTTSGYYQVCLTILDNTGCQDTYCDSIYVNIPLPQNCNTTLTASLIPNTSFVTYTAIPNGQAPFTYRWNFFGNGYSLNPWFQNGIGYLYHGLSDTTVNTCVEITDGTGCIDTACVSIYIPDTIVTNNCHIDFTYVTDTNGMIHFQANPSNGQAVYAYLWTMGDSTIYTGQNPSHPYPNSGIFWACVSIADSTGCTYTYCDTVIVPPFTSTVDIEQLMNIKVFPNPVRDILNINFTILNSTDIEMTVMSATGQIVDQQHINTFSGENQTTISTSQLPTGVYLLRIQSDDGIVTKRFIKR